MTAPETIPPRDEVLLAAYVQGDREAFGALVKRYQQALFDYLYRLVGDGNTAEDLVQDTFVRVLTRLWQFKPDKCFRTWLYAIATNLARKVWRKQKRRRRECLTNDWERYTDRAPEQVQRIILRETQERLQRSIEQLEAPQRTVFILRFYQKLDYREIAAIVGCKPATARTRMFYALEKLRAALEK